MFRFYYGYKPRLVQAGICFTVDYWKRKEDIVLSPDGAELRRYSREKYVDPGALGNWRKLCSFYNYFKLVTGSQGGYVDLENGCRLEFQAMSDPTLDPLLFRLAWKLHAPDRALLATYYDPDYCCYYSAFEIGVYQMSENCFLVQNGRAIWIVNTFCTLQQWSPENDHLLLDRTLLRTWMLVAKRLELDPAIAHRIALLS